MNHIEVYYLLKCFWLLETMTLKAQIEYYLPEFLGFSHQCIFQEIMKMKSK